MTIDDFAGAVEFLLAHDMAARAFILLRPPFLSESEGIEWAMKSVEYSFSLGVGCCSVIPTRAGNGIMDRLAHEGFFMPPTIRSLERVLDYGLSLTGGRVFADLWDIERFFDCAECGPRRAGRIAAMNLSQRVEPAVSCQRCG
jgi:hypothetical protein